MITQISENKKLKSKLWDTQLKNEQLTEKIQDAKRNETEQKFYLETKELIKRLGESDVKLNDYNKENIDLKRNNNILKNIV